MIQDFDFSCYPKEIKNSSVCAIQNRTTNPNLYREEVQIKKKIRFI